jgi:hypothetical protein
VQVAAGPETQNRRYAVSSHRKTRGIQALLRGLPPKAMRGVFGLALLYVPLSPSTDLCSPFDARILRCNNRTTPGAGPSKAAQKPKKTSKHPWSRPKRGGAGHPTHLCSPNWSGGAVMFPGGPGVTKPLLFTTHKPSQMCKKKAAVVHVTRW